MNPGGSSWLQSCRVSAAAFSVTDWWLSLIIDYWLKLWRGLDGWWCHSVLQKHWSLLAERLPTYCWPHSHKVYFITCVDVFCDGYFVVKMFLNAKVKAVSWIKEQTCDSLRAVDGPTPQNKCPVETNRHPAGPIYTQPNQPAYKESTHSHNSPLECFSWASNSNRSLSSFLPKVQQIRLVQNTELHHYIVMK